MIVDVGSKSEGAVPREQFLSPTGELTVKPGDVVDVMIDHGGESSEGYIPLSHDKAARLAVWENLEKAFQEQLTILGRVISRVKGGLAVDVGIKAFMPGSQIDIRPVRNLDGFTGQDIPVKIIKLNRRRGNVVVSRKMALEQESAERKAITMEHLHPGAVLTGIVKERHGLRGVCRPGRDRRVAACHRYFLGADRASLGGAASGRRNHRPGAEV